MKNNLRKLFVLTVFCMAFGGAGSIFGQVKAAGYKLISVGDSGVKNAAAFAVKQKIAETDWNLTLDGILNAETQIVAGTDYRLCLQITAQSPNDEDSVATGWVKTTIHKNPKGEFSIVSWQLEDCAEK